MSSTHLKITDTLAEYIRASSLREPELLVRLREETAALPRGSMQITPEQGQFFSPDSDAERQGHIGDRGLYRL